jgi:hypothetical protein
VSQLCSWLAASSLGQCCLVGRSNRAAQMCTDLLCQLLFCRFAGAQLSSCRRATSTQSHAAHLWRLSCADACMRLEGCRAGGRAEMDAILGGGR